MGMVEKRVDSATLAAAWAVASWAARTLTSPVSATVTCVALYAVGTTHCGRLASMYASTAASPGALMAPAAPATYTLTVPSPTASATATRVTSLLAVAAQNR